MQQNYEIFKDLIQTVWFTLLVLLFVLEKNLWKWPVNWSFSEFFFRPSNPKSDFFTRKSTN